MDYKTRLRSLHMQRSQILSDKTRASDRLAKLTSEVKDLEHNVEVLTQVEALFKHLIDKHVLEYAESFSDVVTEGLQAIFYDQDLQFTVNVEQKHNKVSLSFDTTQGDVTGPALKSFGGGVASVQSLLLRVLVLLKSGLAKYLILDESLAALSTEYVPSAGTFIRKMCEELDVNVLLITHNHDFLEHAHTAYQASENTDGFISLRRVHEDRSAD